MLARQNFHEVAKTFIHIVKRCIYMWQYLANVDTWYHNALRFDSNPSQQQQVADGTPALSME